jgi:nucleoside-diphosphate-sugar epimerase
MTPQKILLTGAAGFLGQQIARSLLMQGATDLRLHVRNQAPAALLDSLRRDFPQARIEVAAANLLARGTLAPMMDGVHTVVHAAAGMKGAAADMFANTVIGSRNVFEAAGAAGVKRVVLISSFSVYKTEQLAPGATLQDDNPVEPVGVDKGPYGYAKTRQEHLLTEMKAHHGFETVVLRPGVIYGPGGGALSPRVGLNVMGWFFSLGGQALLPLTFVENCADAVARAALHAPDGAAYSVVDDQLPRLPRRLPPPGAAPARGAGTVGPVPLGRPAAHRVPQALQGPVACGVHPLRGALDVHAAAIQQCRPEADRLVPARAHARWPAAHVCVAEGQRQVKAQTNRR